MRYRVILEIRSPLAISLSRATGNQLGTLRHVPGSVWRGALARAYLDEKRPVDPASDRGFASLFLNQLVRFGDLRPGGARPWPLSARKCKLNPDHPVLDLLLNTGRRAALPEQCLEYDAQDADNKCKAKLEPPAGQFYAYKKGSAQAERGVARLTAHTAISNYSLRVRPEQFYSAEVIEKGEVFRGEFVAEGMANEAVAQFLLTEPKRILIGRGATRGQGQTELRVGPASEGQVDARKQLGTLTQKIADLNSSYAVPDKVVFSCTLLSPCQVLDAWLGSRSYLTADDVAEAAGCERQELARISHTGSGKSCADKV